MLDPSAAPAPQPAPEVLCIGAAHWDLIGTCSGVAARGDDLPGRIAQRPGGVALNIALTLAALGLRPALLAALGGDAAGTALAEAARAGGLDCGGLLRCAGQATDRYLAIEDAGGLVAAIAEARLAETAGAALLAPLRDGRLGSAARPWAGPVVLDGNLDAGLLAELASDPALGRADLRLAAASPAKAGRLHPLLGHPRLTLYLNREEAVALAGRPLATAREAALALAMAGPGRRRVLVTDGPREAALAGPSALFTATPPEVRAQRVTGAGDRLLAAHVAAELAGAAPERALLQALAAAARHVATAPDPALSP